MKIEKLILVFIVTFLVTNLDAQVLIKSLNTDSEIKLRWLPENHRVWLSGNSEGYEITRSTIAINGLELDLGDMISSTITLKSPIVPLENLAFQSKYPEGTTGRAAWELLYNADENAPDVPSAPKLYDAVAHQDYQESRYLFSLLLAEQDYDLAVDQALGIDDPNVQNGYTYLYKFVNAQDSTELGSIRVDYDGATTLPAAHTLVGIGADRSVELSWDIQDNSDYYNMYWIQRSDGGPFVNVNEVPFTYISEIEDNPERAFYTDSLDNNETVYQYRIQGISPFGVETPYSDTISVSGIPARLDIVLEMDELVEADPGDLKIDWSGTSHEWDADITHFDIFTKLTESGEETLVNSSPIAAADRVYVLQSAPYDAYYRLQATDSNGHIYTTMHFPGRIADTTPPAAPQGASGKILEDGMVLLNWEANTEPDLMGYKVFYANGKNGEYSPVSQKVFVDNKYTASVVTDIDVDSIYYKLAAYDLRYNRSAYSEPIALARPDNNPPGAPHLVHALSRKEGIRLSWRLSGSPDVVEYRLMRKYASATTWEAVYTFAPSEAPQDLPMVNGEMLASQYIDESELQLRPYDYRLLAIDDSGNKSASLVRQVIPFNNLIRGRIKPYTSVDISSLINSGTLTVVGAGQTGLNTTGTVVSPTSGTLGGLTLDAGQIDADAVAIFAANGTPLNPNGFRKAAIAWQYESDYLESLVSFKIYVRKKAFADQPTDNDVYIQVANISKEKVEQLAQTLGIEGYALYDQIRYQGNDPIYLKILAMHKDGSTSKLSIPVQASLF